MSITDELRKYISGTARCGISPICEKSLANIADRIDAEHESACAEAYGNGVMSVPIALDESAWVELPKDADDVPWRIGDRDEDGNVVTELRLTYDGCWFVITDGEWPYRPKRKRHHHAPTVEDVLQEFAYGLGVPVADSYIAATAAKLRLAEGED